MEGIHVRFILVPTTKFCIPSKFEKYILNNEKLKKKCFIIEFCFLKRIKDLHVHVKEEHPEKDKSCIACGHLCDSRQDLDKHIQVFHFHIKYLNIYFQILFL